MHDARIEELLTAYLKHELEFEQYRHLRTEYIDSLNNSWQITAPDQSTTEDSDTTHEEITSLSPIHFRQNRLMFLGAIFLLVIIIVVSVL